MIREADRIARQAGILPSVLKRHISQLEDFHFLVGGVKASGLEKKKQTQQGPRGNRTMSEGFWERKEDGGAFSPPAIRHHLHQKLTLRQKSPPESVSGGTG